MKKRLYISNDEAGFFDNNKMLCLDNPPTQGDFIVGDIVISNKQENGVFGWVCVLAGSPGRWEVICDIVEIIASVSGVGVPASVNVGHHNRQSVFCGITLDCRVSDPCGVIVRTTV